MGCRPRPSREPRRPRPRRAPRGEGGPRPPLAPGILIVILVILIIANALFTVGVFIAESEWYISRNQIASLTELQTEIPENGRVVIVGNIALAEWAPAILQREVLNIEYGLEWQPDELEKVKAINEAIEENDFAAMIMAIEVYTDDQQVYLIASKDDRSTLQDSMPQNAALLLVLSTAELDLNILEIK